MDNTFIKLFRKFEEWEWYTDTNTKVLFLHLLIKANFKNKKWRGIQIKRGERLTSISHLANETGLSNQNIKTAIKKLKSTKEIEVKTTTSYTLIKLINYEKYQNGKNLNSKLNSDQQSLNKSISSDSRFNNSELNSELNNNQITIKERLNINKESKKDNNVNKYNYIPQDFSFAEKFWEFSGERFIFTQKLKPKDIPEIKKKWANEFRKLREIDKMNSTKIEFLLNWLFYSKSNNAIFWREQIRSPMKLRKKDKDKQQYWRVLVEKIRNEVSKPAKKSKIILKP